jgi:5'-3' exonuclease
MKSILHIVDISPCIYAGSYNTHSFIQGGIINTGNGYRERNIPTGGASMLFNILGQYMGTGPVVFVADRNPTIKKDKYADYKKSRTHPTNISIEKAIAEYILTDCGFTVYAEDGYEADDVIYTMVTQNRTKYDHIFVHTADSDLYTLVRDNVSILPTSSKAKYVTMANYAYTCKKGKDTPYNTVVFQKFLKGDASKNLPPLSKNEQHRLNAAFDKENLLPYLGDQGNVKMMLEQVFSQYLDRATLFYPLLIPVNYNLKAEGDKARIQNWAWEIGNRRVPAKRGDLTKKIEEMMGLALYVE